MVLKDSVQTYLLKRNSNAVESEMIHRSVPKYVLCFHKLVIKPISFIWSTRILRNEIITAVGNVKNKTIMDVSAGDDPTILRFAKDAKWVVANDISLYSMVPLISKNRYENVVFTSQNLLDLQFERVDILICKNTLHHMRTRKQLKKSLQNLKKIGKMIIIMDVEDPKKQFVSRLWNSYYRYLLKDQGERFLSYQEFSSSLREVFKREFSIKRVKTIKGIYMLAIINST